MNINMEEKIKYWKKNLLDLGKRNRLINYRTTKRSTLNIKVPSMVDLWNSFVEEEKPLIFPYKADAQDDTELSVILENEKNPVITDKVTYGDLQKTLANLRNKSKSVSEEQGINTLYLAFGFLKWEEAIQSKQTIVSPLLLVPVKLTLESLMSPFSMSLGDDEIVVNPALSHKFNKDFGIELPKFDEDVELSTFIENIKKIAASKNWEVEETTSLGLFSFLKINMYYDLERNKDIISNHSIIRAICGDKDALTPIPEEINDSAFDLDSNITPEETFQVLDSDSSQQKAILCANKGVSFILQGPPGTGKSQTITNIIAESLANGKKVLFVSEKIAALDVVYKRLTASGLDDFCLVLHSYKANKQEVLDQLNSSLELAGKKTKLAGEAKLKLEQLYFDKLTLDQYAKELHKIIEPLGKNIYEINGKIALLEHYPDVIFNLDNVRNTDEKQINRYINVLSHFKETLSEQALNPELNPWKNTSLKGLTNEFRHNLNALLPLLVQELEKIINASERFIKRTGLEKVITNNTLNELKPLLKKLIGEHYFDYKWFAEYKIKDLINETETNLNENLQRTTLITDIINLFSSIPDSEKHNFNIDRDSCFTDSVLLRKIQNNLNQAILSDEILTSLNDCKNIYNIESQYNLYHEKTDKILDIKNEILESFEDDIFSLDVKPIITRIKTEYTSIFRVFKKSYKADVKAIKAYAKDFSMKIKNNYFIDVVCKLNEINKIKTDIKKDCKIFIDIFNSYLEYENTNFNLIKDKIDTICIINKLNYNIDKLLESIHNFELKEVGLANAFGSLYKGLETQWSVIKDELNYSLEVKSSLEDLDIHDAFLHFICEAPDRVEVCKTFLDSLNDYNIKTDEALSFYYSLFIDDETNLLKQFDLVRLQKRIIKNTDNIAFLEQWLDYNRICEECKNEGLEEYINQVVLQKIDKENIIPCFEKRFYALWLDSVINDFPAVRDFRRYKQDATIADFANLDKEQCEIAKARIREKLINSLPVVGSFSSSLDEVGVLKKEINKQRRRMPIRKLFRSIPNIIMSFKPCLMMSPLSVSLFLESNAYQFDVVIFDEASQVRTENAIGAISRGKQLIIAGDSKQLPPTNFFNVTTSDIDFDSDEDIEEDSGDYESIIDEANLLPEETLKWHYRSRDEQLIAFSNAKIYKNKLITFPSNKSENVKDNGVEYYYMKDGVYDRGGSKGNIVEANKVADLIFEHFTKYPSKSLGVITFGEKQQHIIESVVIERRKKHPEFEEFFNEDILDEPFFIKNLENVQGDERDTIIFSIGYAKDNNGVFRMNFGPLNKMGGERRLNVAITRAKYNLKLVGSILPTDIDVDKISSEGPKLLRAYIDFAQNGISALNNAITESDITEFDSPFEESVYNFLDRKGYKVATQVGCSEYRIDLAIKHPTISGVYVLGIECDGATYHSSKTARDRDRLRQDVLENMGWTIYRIWSTDWIKDSKAEGERLISAIDDAIKNYSMEKKTVNKNVSEKQFLVIKDTPVVDENNLYGFDLEDVSDRDLLPKDFMVDTRTINGLSYQVSYYCKNAGDVFYEAIKQCNPMHIDILSKQLLNHTHIEPKRLSKTVKFAVRCALYDELKSGKVKLVGDFFVLGKGNNYCTHFNNTRKIELIATEEMAKAMYQILSKKVGLTVENLYIETANAYNFHRMTNVMKEYLTNAFNLLVDNNKLSIVDNKIKLID